MILKQELSKDGSLSSAFSLGLRLQPGIIFFEGLLLLVTTTIVITYIISNTSEQQAAGLSLSTPETLPSTEASLQIHQATNIGMVRGIYEILTLIARGASNQEIADTLFLSLHTKKSRQEYS